VVQFVLEPNPSLLNEHLTNITLGLRIRAVRAYNGQIGNLLGEQDSSDPLSGLHADRVTLLANKSLQISASLNPGLGIDDKDFTDLITASLLHDIGKITSFTMIDRIRKNEKRPPVRNPIEPFNEEEIIVVRQTHLLFTREILNNHHFPPHIQQIALSHQDIIRAAPGYKCGDPYPRHHDIIYNGKDKRVPLDPKTRLMAEILWFADKFDRLINGYGPHQQTSFEELLSGYQVSFDPQILENHQDLIPIILTAARDTFFEPDKYTDRIARLQTL
jgi:hypothetical protein